MKDFKKYLAEALGTLILAGVGVYGALHGMNALAFGLTFLALAFILGGISGAHINPAVSLGMAIKGRISWLDCLCYMIAQFIGAIIGTLFVYSLVKLSGGANTDIGADLYSNFGANHTWQSILAVLMLETFMTFVFVLTFIAVTSKVTGNSTASGLVIGLTLLGLLAAGAIMMNPAISLAKVIFSADATAWREVWVFLLAPLLGGALAALVAYCHQRDKREKAPARSTSSK
jgi:aquaporin Z